VTGKLPGKVCGSFVLGDERVSEKSVRLVRIIARKFSNTGLPEEDLVQEGLLGYMKAEMTFKPESGFKFETYASRVISNRFIDIIRRKRHMGNDGLGSLSGREIAGDFSLDDQVNLIEIKNILSDRVPELERAIFNSWIQGFSYEEISKIFDLPRKKIDNTVQKVKKIVKAHI